MTVIHVVLVLMSSISVAMSWTSLSPMGRMAAVAGVLAMVLAMNGPFLAVLLALGLLLGCAPIFISASQGALCWHRAASHLAMAGTILALLLVNGAGICGQGARPLLSLNGIAMPLVPTETLVIVQLCAWALMAYALWGVALLVRAAFCARPWVALEVSSMTCATFGMAVVG